MSTETNTSRVGIFGWPVAHSLSPAMHSAAFRDLGLDWHYEALAAKPENLAQEFRRRREEGFCGFNVTIPHKEAIIPLLDEVDDEARAIGAVNTVVIRDGRARGFNTDVDGFLIATRDEAGVELQGARVVILGAGGAARAIAAGCVRGGAACVTACLGVPSQAETLIADMRRYADEKNADVELRAIESGADDAVIRAAVAEASVVANATPVGMENADDAPIDPKWLPAGAAVFEAIYTHPETALMRAAREGGGKTIHGLRMLLHQGAKAFELWTGQKPRVEVMFRALEEARS